MKMTIVKRNTEVAQESISITHMVILSSEHSMKNQKTWNIQPYLMAVTS